MKVVEGKVVVLGSQGVGKTSLVVRYIGKMFSQHISPTIGASFFTCRINMDDATVKLQVWDTAGQERFRSMAPMYYRNANAALLVYDVSNAQSFAAVKGWVKELQSVASPPVLSLVGNKSDLRGAVPPAEAAAYAQEISAHYAEVSALKDQGIEQVFLTTARALLRLSPPPAAQLEDDTHTGARSDEVTHSGRVELPAIGIARAEPHRSLCC